MYQKSNLEAVGTNNDVLNMDENKLNKFNRIKKWHSEKTRRR